MSLKQRVHNLFLAFAMMILHLQTPLFTATQFPSSTSDQPLATTSTLVQIAAGGKHSCILTSSGGVKCWGDNAYGQLGDGTTTLRHQPVDVIGLTSSVSAIAVGYRHSCAALATGGVKCWGANWSGQLGDGTADDRSTPVTVQGIDTSVIALTGSLAQSCALISNGAVKCWGYGQLTANDVPGLTSGIKAISALGDHACASTEGGATYCWGSNLYGQLGDGTTTNQATPVAVSGLGNGVTAIAAGYFHSCAIINGGVKCWGRYYGLTPVDVTGLESGIVAITAGGDGDSGANQSCALTALGSVRCWGTHQYGELGAGDTDYFYSATPVEVVGLPGKVSLIRSGGQHVCALTAGSAALCWGRNDYGQLGNGSGGSQLTPVDVSRQLGNVRAMTFSGAFGTPTACVLSQETALKCWGNNFFGQIGDGTQINRLRPTQLSGLDSNIISATFRCAVTSNGAAKCWGRNFSGEVGDGSTEDRTTPVDVSGLGSGVAMIASGDSHSCVLTTSGGVKCWGNNDGGRLGDGSTTQQSTPVDVVGMNSDVSQIALGGSYSCAVTQHGVVKCWGHLTLTATEVNGFAGSVKAISVGGGHQCAVTTSGGVKCWGYNKFGQLGDGSATDSTVPIDVSGLRSDVDAVAAGNNHSCALTKSGSVKCWGDNRFGQLGNGTTESALTPAEVDGLNHNVTAIFTGDDNSCALINDGTIKCWGNNRSGQVGDATAWSTVPIYVVGFGPTIYLPIVTK